MVADGADRDGGSEASDSTSGASRIGTAARVALALGAVVLGVVWTVRIAMDGTVASGVLLRLLAPVALIYLGVRYFRSVVHPE